MFSIDSSTELTGTVRARPAVPWWTVLPLAGVLAYADGFWMVALRGAVGAIERTQEPFTSWWRESTLALPIYILVVLAALTLALRLFGPVLRTAKTVLATGALLVAGGTVVGVTQIVASTLYDYHLQSDQLAMMDSMHGLCTGSCLEQAQQSSIAALLRAVLYVSGILLVTNLVLVGWVMAMKGGRLTVAAAKQPVSNGNPRRVTDSRSEDLRLLLIAGLLGSAVIHAAVIPDHLAEWTAAGVFFILLTVAQVAIAGLLMTRLNHALLLTGVLLNAGLLLLWLYSRTLGLPFGPNPGIPESIGLADILAGILEVAALLAAVLLLRAHPPATHPPASAHRRGLILLAVIAVTAIGLYGAAPNWFDDSSGGDPPTMVAPG
jgi:hypothetical protein